MPAQSIDFQTKKSDTQSTIIHTDPHLSQSFQPEIKRQSQHLHSRSQTKNQRPFRKNTRSVTTIHTTIRSSNNNHHPSNNQSITSKHDLLSFSGILATHQHQNKLNKQPIIQKVARQSKIITRPISVTTIGSYETPDCYSKENSWYNDNSQSNLTKTNNEQNSKRKDGWPDWTSFEHEHHRNNKKKKKKWLRPCLVICLLTCILIVIAITIILILLLTKSKSSVTSTNTTAVLRWRSYGITIAGISTSAGITSDKLNNPSGLALDFVNTLYVADWNNNRVQKYVTGTLTGTTVAGQANGSTNTTSHYLHYPSDIALDSNSNIYIVDNYNNRIQLWNSGASSGTTIIGTGTAGSTINQLNKPYAIARDTISGTLYIADTMNNRIIRFPSGASVGTEITCGNGSGTNNIQLFWPRGLVYDSSSDSLTISNYLKNNVVRYSFSSKTCTIVGGYSNATGASTSTGLSFPAGVTLDPMGNIYVADQLNHRIQFFLADQSVGSTIAGITGVYGSNSTLLFNPSSLTLDSQLNLYVSDTTNHRVQKFLRY